MKTKLVPFTFETFPKGIVWIKHIKSNRVYLVLSIETKFIATVEDEIFFDADTMYFEISTDLCRTWQPFGVVEEVEEPKRWRANNGNNYYFVEGDHIAQWIDERGQHSNNMFNMGNYFRTEEEAKTFLKKIKAVYKENLENIENQPISNNLSELPS